MPGIHKKTIVRYLDAKGRQVPSNTPGARKVKQKSGKWYGRLPKTGKIIPLCKNKKDAETMLAALVKQEEVIHFDPDFTRVLDAWPTLSATLRGAVLALIDAAHAEGV